MGGRCLKQFHFKLDGALAACGWWRGIAGRFKKKKKYTDCFKQQIPSLNTKQWESTFHSFFYVWTCPFYLTSLNNETLETARACQEFSKKSWLAHLLLSSCFITGQMWESIEICQIFFQISFLLKNKSLLTHRFRHLKQKRQNWWSCFLRLISIPTLRNSPQCPANDT